MKKVLLLFLLLFLTGCKDHEIDGDGNDKNKIEREITVSEGVILKDTPYETNTYHYTTNIEGPKVVLIGGIHGDEVAGWTAAEMFVETNNFVGEVLLIPKANSLATYLVQRFPGSNDNGNYNGEKYSDLNRIMPGKKDGTVTEKIANEIYQTIMDFNPDFVVDMHESIRNYADSKPRLGNSIIYENIKSSIVVMQLVEEYNKLFTEEGELPFIYDNSPPQGSFNYHFGNIEGFYTFTIETDRQLPLEKRITQQINIVNTFFELIKEGKIR